MNDSLFIVRTQRGIDAAYDMRFDEARQVFTQIEQQYPNHPVAPFLKALIRWWRILGDLGDRSIDDSFHADMTEVSQRCDRLLAKDPQNFDAILFKGLAVAFRSRLYANRSSWVNAFRYGKQSVDYVTAAAKISPENNDYYFGWGVYDYFADVLPKKYKYLDMAMFMLPNGNRERGLEEIKRTFNRGTFMRAEAAYYLFQINYVYEPRYEGASYYIGWLRNKYPNNSFYHVLEARVQQYFGRSDQAMNSFNEIVNRHLRKQTGYNAAIAEQAYFYLGTIELFRGHYDQARDYFTRQMIVTNDWRTPSDYGIMGRVRLGMAHDALKNRIEAKKMYQMALQMRDVNGSKQAARNFLEKPYQQ
jgi:tetratricopeptide (TPR) repeat protein